MDLTHRKIQISKFKIFLQNRRVRTAQVIKSLSIKVVEFSASRARKYTAGNKLCEGFIDIKSDDSLDG